MRLTPKTIEKLKETGVGIVYLFGSRAEALNSPKADYDIGIVFRRKKSLFQSRSNMYSQIYAILSEELEEQLNGPRLDISFLESASPALQMSAVKKGIVLFEISPEFRADFEEQVVKRYDDYLPLKREYEEATLRSFR